MRTISPIVRAALPPAFTGVASKLLGPDAFIVSVASVLACRIGLGFRSIRPQWLKVSAMVVVVMMVSIAVSPDSQAALRKGTQWN
jgi:hypothetical protein